MEKATDTQKKLAVEWFYTLRDKVRESFVLLEKQFAKEPKVNKRIWKRIDGGGGESTIIYGDVFEKVGINVSEVYGKFSDSVINEIPGANESNGKFWAGGISIVSHMQSPLIPAAHMNTRLIYTSKQWFGGGIDFTPMYYDEADYQYIHNTLKTACDKFNPEYYIKFKHQCDDYFFLPHRQESRGIGGIFYDNLNSGDWHDDFNFTKAVGETFLEIFLHIIKRHINEPWTEAQREHQLIRRGRYVEFNLLYDRGTRFGLITNGNPDAIMMSMPPLVKWI
ncbi:coproporphyrinogen III oxidase [Wolbachia pipientis]|uniref:coproporphyrinogen oxidase n=1 Tax=Wolbachia pipientis TaxID=955 RepID=A0A1E7QKW0_WOLPI|nr:oxygen-dependent coproporphyrinogen oxidase [Wolbachia pipientis]OEY87112.1 coproporphyrinogen III oxidase [Wolbachia pipientis]